MKIINIVLRATQRGGGGSKWGNLPGATVKGGPKIFKKGGPERCN
jgi:hypothetical protein